MKDIKLYATIGATGAAALIVAALYLLAQWKVPDITQNMPGFALGLVAFGLVAQVLVLVGISKTASRTHPR